MPVVLVFGYEMSESSWDFLAVSLVLSISLRFVCGSRLTFYSDYIIYCLEEFRKWAVIHFYRIEILIPYGIIQWLSRTPAIYMFCRLTNWFRSSQFRISVGNYSNELFCASVFRYCSKKFNCSIFKGSGWWEKFDYVLLLGLPSLCFNAWFTFF